MQTFSTDTVIYTIRYITMKSIDSENLRLNVSKIERYIKQSNGDKYLIFTATNMKKKVLKKQTALWNKIKNPIETINCNKPFK